MEQILQKNKKNLSYLEHYKKTTNGIQFRNDDEKHSLIQIDNEKNYIENPSSHYYMLRYYYL